MSKTPYEMQPGSLFFWPMKWNGNILFRQYRIKGRADCKHREKHLSETKRMPLPNLLPLFSPLAEQRHHIEKDILNSWNHRQYYDWLTMSCNGTFRTMCLYKNDLLLIMIVNLIINTLWLWLLTLLVFNEGFNFQVSFIVIKVGFGVKFLDKLKFKSLNSHGNLWNNLLNTFVLFTKLKNESENHS